MKPKDILAGLGGLLMMAAMGVLSVFLLVLIIKGSAWASSKLLPWFTIGSLIAFGIEVFVLLPLAIPRATRAFSSVVILILSYLFGLTLWMESLLLSLVIWGLGAVLVGFLIVGVGVVPIAMLATLINGMWSVFVELILLAIATFASRIGALQLMKSLERDATGHIRPLIDSSAKDAEIDRMQQENGLQGALDALDEIFRGEEDRSRRDRLQRQLDALEDPETIFVFGQMAFEGDGVEQNYAEAAAWYRIAAERGHAKSQHNLAVMCEHGQGIPLNLEEAAKWYRMAADQGHAGSQNNLAAMYESGHGAPEDKNVALDLYRQADKSGDANASFNVRRLEEIIEFDRQLKIVTQFANLVSDHSPLIGDCTALPHTKETILYAIRFLADNFMEKQDGTSDAETAKHYSRMAENLNFLFTCLARDWHHIPAEDKNAVDKLKGLKDFPDWALPLKQKYIDEGKAKSLALDIALRVLEDKAKRDNT